MPSEKEVKKFKNPFLATDLIIEYFRNSPSEMIILIERKNKPYGLALPGGFAEYGLSLGQNAIKEAKEETGLDVWISDEEHPLCVHSRPDRDPRAHIISVTYLAGVKGGILKGGDDAKDAKPYHIMEIRDLIETSPEKFAFPDHIRAIKDYLKLKEDKWYNT